MRVYEMRRELSERYSPDFARRLSAMTDDQIIAIWHRVREADRAVYELRTIPKQTAEHQLTLF